jgi:co-chaperonin GroES (HSP10)
VDVINKIDFSYDNLDEAFPPVDPGVQPFGSRVLCQLRTPKSVTKGGIHLLGDTRETEHWNTQVAKVLAVGELAFRNRQTRDLWPEGSWCEVGEFVRVPKYGGDRWTVSLSGREDALLILFNDLDLLGKITGDPLAIKAYV